MSSEIEGKIFKYGCLTEPDSFRLLSLQPSSSHGSDLQCFLLYTTISQCDHDIIDHYTALSYVWGDPTETGQIYVDGVLVTVTATLAAALRDLRDSSRVLRIWADALCIDQSNLSERSSQVGLMGQIYATAHHTVIHLGPLTNMDETVLQATPSNTSGTVTKPLTTSEVVELAENSILRMPWFTRVWIFQELVLSRDPWVQCGTLRARWTELCNLLLASNTAGKPKELKVLEDMNSSRMNLRQNMFNLLLARRGLGATDSRDMIYAHMGIASDVHLLYNYITVDYNTGCAVLYENIARYFLETVGPQVFFGHADDRSRRSQRTELENLASWSPDWTLPSSGLALMFRNNTMYNKKLDPKAHYTLLGEPLVLAYIGYEVDTVASFSLELPDPTKLDPDRLEIYRQSIRDLEALYQRGSGVWWSGDENGQYPHMDLRGREAEHETLCQKLGHTWIQVMSEELPLLSSVIAAEDVEANKQFLSKFGPWLESRASQRIIMSGTYSDRIESAMSEYLRPLPSRKILAGRRLAITETGRVGIVPTHVKAGDALIYVAGSLISLTVRRDPKVRGENLNLKIREALSAKLESAGSAATGRLSCDTKSMDIQDYTLVGECYVDGEVAWKIQEDSGRNYTIYALR